MADTEILDMPVELCLEFMPVIGADFLDAKWALVDDVVDEIDGVGLGVFCVDLKGADAGSSSIAVYWKRRTFSPFFPMKVRNFTSIWMWWPGTCLLYCFVWILRTRVPRGKRLRPWRLRMR